MIIIQNIFLNDFFLKTRVNSLFSCVKESNEPLPQDCLFIGTASIPLIISAIVFSSQNTVNSLIRKAKTPFFQTIVFSAAAVLILFHVIFLEILLISAFLLKLKDMMNSQPLY